MRTGVFFGFSSLTTAANSSLGLPSCDFLMTFSTLIFPPFLASFTALIVEAPIHIPMALLVTLFLFLGMLFFIHLSHNLKLLYSLKISALPAVCAASYRLFFPAGVIFFGFLSGYRRCLFTLFFRDTFCLKAKRLKFRY